MTIETRTTIGINDITAIEFECAKCHTKIAYPVAHLFNAPLRCGTCEESQQWLIPDSDDWKDLKQLGLIIQRFSKPNNQIFFLRLEITGE
jgi:hypothetical protein